MKGLHNKHLSLTQLLLATAIITNLHAADENEQSFDDVGIEELNRLGVADNAIDLDIERIGENIDQLLLLPAASAPPPAAYSLVVPETDAMMRMAKALAINGGPELIPQMSAFIRCFEMLSPTEKNATVKIFNDDTVTMGEGILALQIIASSFGTVEEARMFLNERAFVAGMEGIN
jgi:hypothetical protein